VSIVRPLIEMFRTYMATRVTWKGVLRCAAACGVVTLGVQPLTVAAQDQSPRFRSSVEVTSVDVTVIDGDGRPVDDLTPDEFTVSIDGTPRRVIAAEWVALGTPKGDVVDPLPDGYSSNGGTLGGRLIVLVLDLPHIRFGGVRAIQSALFEFIDRLPSSDHIAVVGIGPGAAATPFTTDRQQVRDAIGLMPGSKTAGLRPEYRIGITEALDVHRGQPFALERIIERECRGLTDIDLRVCEAGVQSETKMIAFEAIYAGRITLDGLRGLLRALRSYDAPKTLVFVSEGFYFGDTTLALDEVEQLAAVAQTSIYALQLDGRDFDMERTARATAVDREDRDVAANGLAAIANDSRGSLFNVVASAAGVLSRIESELSGYYVLGVESDPADRAAGSRPISIRVARSGTSVRSRRRLFGESEPARLDSPREQVAHALTLPLILSGLSLRVATFSLRGPDPSKVQLLIHADVGEDYTSSRVVALGYVITDPDGRVVDSQAADARLPPVMNGVPSPLQFTGGASLDPGKYTLKLAVLEGDRIGTIEHPLDAGLTDAGEVLFSELTVGGPPSTSDLLRPTVGRTVSFGIVHGYIEAYGPRATEVSASFEIAPHADGPALLSGDVSPHVVGDDRVIFTDTMFVRRLPPGSYVLRARLSMTSEGDLYELDTIVREFEVAPPAVFLTSADSVGPPRPSGTELFLPVTDEHFRRPFNLEDVARPETLEAFRTLVAPSASEAFERGVSLLRDGQYERAEAALKSAMDVENSSTAPLTYLAAVFAASGHDDDAASVWQTALIDGSDRPEIYEWLGDALLRAGDYKLARIFLEEANEKWPWDVRFAKPLALLYATFGQGREAVRTLKRHLEAFPDDVDALALGVEWLYVLHSAGYAAYAPAEDRQTARSWAETYGALGGADVALIGQWVDFLEGRVR